MRYPGLQARSSVTKETKPMLQGKIVIVTGGAKGIGRYAAHTLAQAGGNVVIVDVDIERLHKTLGELRDLKFEAWALVADVRHEDEVRRMVHQVVDRYGQIDVLVNDAGIVPHFNWGIPRWPRVRFMSKDFWDNVIQTNLGGTFLCTKYIVPFMEACQSGNIVNLWGGGRAENHGAAAYVVSKDAIRTFTRFVAEEEREWNVCVVAFSPKQAIATEDAPEEARKRLPGPECLGNGFVLAAQAGMDLTGKTVEHRDGNLVVVD
jgi:3-oxoacyl-[acyl-carrier protein] reductase